jgi:hypothetical protein
VQLAQAADFHGIVTKCTLPFGAIIQTPFLSHCNVQAADYGLPGHVLSDTATLTWQDTCSPASPNCSLGNKMNTASSQANVNQPNATVSTTIHNSSHQGVTTVEAGSTVHDFVSVTSSPGAPVPTGNVSIDWLTNGSCSRNPAANSGSVGVLDGSGNSMPPASRRDRSPPVTTRSTRTTSVTGRTGPSDGPCEPLTVVDANIQITPDGVN